MSRLGIRWVVLYLLSILVPAALLAFLSVRSLRDVRDSVRQELRSKTVLAQDAFDRLINSRDQLLSAYSEDGAMDPRLYAGFSEIAQIFAIDPSGALRHPAVQPLHLQERRAAFAAQMEKAAEREFGHQDWAGGVQLYHQAWKEAASPAEEAEALNALARCAYKGKDAAMEEKAHRTLVTLYGHVFDADGAHPVTLSHLRLGRYAAPEQAQASLMAWTEALLKGRYPLYAGCQQALQEAHALTQGRLADMEDRTVLLERLALIKKGLDFSMRFGPVVEDQWARAREQGYLSGVWPDGTSFLMYLGAAESGGVVGILFDWAELTTLVQEQVEGLAERDFSLALFDADAEAAFLAAHREAIYETGPASRWMDRIRLGIWAADTSAATGYHRTRNYLVGGGIFALAVSVVLGGLMILRDAGREVQVARLRSEFVANVSHELRTPLTSIRMYAETLLMGRYRSNEQMQDYLTTLLHESRRLSRLVDNVLDFARIERGDRTYQRQPCDLGTVARDALETFGGVFAAEGFEVEEAIVAELPPVLADQEAVEGAVANILGNAVKYSSEHKAIRLAVEQRDAEVIVEVADRGIGLPAGEEDRIFEQFHRGANAASTAGTGLGLSLVKNVVEAHGGRVEAANRPDGGSVFRLYFPVHTEDNAHA
ncbi:MAG: HAMP domain-containing histidine kinase [Gemmatimonadetes bacterium]|nr:HAMP domain-containing histidine kinase [Gemmatimonadota bacterium]MYK40508.1 HAMP domain-containing histidine kinase [Gemmatimonadota bacterium]